MPISPKPISTQALVAPEHQAGGRDSSAAVQFEAVVNACAESRTIEQQLIKPGVAKHHPLSMDRLSGWWLGSVAAPG